MRKVIDRWSSSFCDSSKHGWPCPFLERGPAGTITYRCARRGASVAVTSTGTLRPRRLLNCPFDKLSIIVEDK